MLSRRGWTRRDWTGAARPAAAAAEVPNSKLPRLEINRRTFRCLAASEAVMKGKDFHYKEARTLLSPPKPLPSFLSLSVPFAREGARGLKVKFSRKDSPPVGVC